MQTSHEQIAEIFYTAQVEHIIAERVSVRQLLRVVFSRYTYVRMYVSVTLKNVN